MLTSVYSRQIARALATTLLPEGSFEDRSAILDSIPDLHCRQVLSYVLLLAEELLASTTDGVGVDDLERTLKTVCLYGNDDEAED